MKKYILIIFFFIPLLCFSQANSHKIFGIDLNSDCYSLKNKQKFAYWKQGQDKNSNFVLSDCDYIHNKIDAKFLSLGFKELLLIFPKGYEGDLNSLSPVMFLARISYDNINDYASKSINDMTKTLSFLKDEYGEAKLNMIRDKFSVYKWEGVYYEIILTCREDELTTTLMYTKK